MALLDAAREVRERAYVPYSKFKVGAAVRGAAGRPVDQYLKPRAALSSKPGPAGCGSLKYRRSILLFRHSRTCCGNPDLGSLRPRLSGLNPGPPQ